MKKFIIVFTMVAALMMVSCVGNNSKKAKAAAETEQTETKATEEGCCKEDGTCDKTDGSCCKEKAEGASTEGTSTESTTTTETNE